MDLEALLKEIPIHIKTCDEWDKPNKDILSSNETPADFIENYLECQQKRRFAEQRREDLVILQNLVQQELDRCEREAQEKAIQEEAKTKEKNIAADTKKLVKQLSRIDLCTPEAANKLIELTILRRQ